MLSMTFSRVKASKVRAALIVHTMPTSRRHDPRPALPAAAFHSAIDVRRKTITRAIWQSQFDTDRLSSSDEHCTFSSSESAKAASTQLVRMYRSALWRASAAEGLSWAAAIRGFEGASESGATMISGPVLSPVSSWRRPESVWRRTLSYHSPPHNHTPVHWNSSLCLSLAARNAERYRLSVTSNAIACRHWRDPNCTESNARWIPGLNVCRAAIMIRPIMLPLWRTKAPERRRIPSKLQTKDHTRNMPISLIFWEEGMWRKNKGIEWNETLRKVT